MKKLFLVVAASLIGFVASAQMDESSSNETPELKPVAGDWSAEFQFAPLGGSPIGLDNLRFRYFYADRMAYRLNIGIYSSSEGEVDSEMNAAGSTITLEDKTSNFQLNLRPGIEKHFAGTDRLSPYVGAEIDFALATSKFTDEEQNVTEDAIVTSETTGEDGFLRIGLNAVAGFDFYIAKRLYLGAEMGFGFNITSHSEIEFTPPVGDSVTRERGSDFNLGPNTIGTLRLGFLF